MDGGHLDGENDTLESQVLFKTCREGSGNVQGIFREYSGKVQGRFREGSGKVQGRLREGSGKA